MENAVKDQVVLYREEVDDERLCIACAFTEEGQLEVMQMSEGPLTYWCFEESPHYVSTMFEREAIEGMLAYFHVEEDRDLLHMLRASYVGCDAGRRVRGLARRLGCIYTVHENAIVR